MNHSFVQPFSQPAYAEHPMAELGAQEFVWRAGESRCPSLTVAILLVFFALLVTPGQAGISEPDTIFYGKIVNRTSGQEDVLTQGVLTWTIQKPDGTPLTLSTSLQPLNGGAFSYRLLVPHEALAFSAIPAVDAVPLTTSLATCSHLAVTLDGNPATIMAPGFSNFSVAEALRGSTHRLDLEVFSPLPDTAGDGIPDWWKAKYGVTDPNADPFGDGWSNLQAFLHGANPTNDNRIPSLATREVFVLAGGTTGVLLDSIDSDSGPTNLVYTLLAVPQTGTLFLRNSQAGSQHTDGALVPGSEFTQADVNRGRLVFSQLSTDTNLQFDSFSVSLRDETQSHPSSTNTVSLNIYVPSYPTAVLQQAQTVAPAPAAFADIAGLTFYEQQMLLNYFLSRDQKYIVWDNSRASASRQISVPSSGLSATAYQQYVANYGADRPQVLIAGAGGDRLVAGMENDILIAGRGGDTLRGNGGSDLFVIPASTRGQVAIQDFTVSENDVLDISRVLTGNSSLLSNYIQVNQIGTNTLLALNVQGTGGNFTDLVVLLSGVQLSPADLKTLIANGNILTGNRGIATEVSITATGPGASQNGLVSGHFTLTRSGALDSALTVYLQISGSAVNGNDYQYVPSQVTFASGQRTMTLSINPYLTSSVLSQFVQVTVSPGAGYDLGASTIAQLTIEPLLPQISIQALAPVGSRFDQTPGVLLVSRGGAINSSVVVTLSVGGTAPATDYNPIPLFLNFAPQQTTSLISITPKPTAALASGTESVRVSVTPGSSFKVIEPSSAQVLLVDQLLTFGSWQKKYFPNSTETTPVFAVEDSGQAGVLNLFRYAYGLNPYAPQEALRFPSSRLFDDHLLLSFKRPPAISDINYVVEVSDDMLNWHSSSTDVEEYFPSSSSNDFETVYFRSAKAVSQNQNQFMRVRVMLQP